jgi:hypothetical protein
MTGRARLCAGVAVLGGRLVRRQFQDRLHVVLMTDGRLETRARRRPVPERDGTIRVGDNVELPG